MSAKGREEGLDAPPSSEAVTAAAHHRVVVVASPYSTAWQAAREAAGDHIHLLDPMRASDARTIGHIQPPADAQIPRWAVYDCAEVPGAVIALVHAGAHPEGLYEPVALLLATPHAEVGSWHFYGLHVCSPVESDSALALRLIEAAWKLLKPTRVTMIQRWSCPWLGRLAQHYAIEVLAAVTPLYDEEEAATLLIRPAQALEYEGETHRSFVLAHDAEDRSVVIERMQHELDRGGRLMFAPCDSSSPSGVVIREITR